MSGESAQLEKIKEYASLLMTVPDIAVLIGCDEDELRDRIACKKTPQSLAYRTGRAETLLEIRRQEIELAKNASPMAVENVQNYLLDQLLSEK